jgi:uncharacterized protein
MPTALAEEGINLILVARKIRRLEQLADELRARHRVQIKVKSLNLAIQGAASALKASLDEESIFVDTLINNAGAGVFGPFTDQSLERVTETLQLNVVAATELTHLFASAMKERGGGQILMVSSLGAYQPCPFYAAYAASKT